MGRAVGGRSGSVQWAVQVWMEFVPPSHQSWFSPEKTNFDAFLVPLWC